MRPTRRGDGTLPDIVLYITYDGVYIWVQSPHQLTKLTQSSVMVTINPSIIQKATFQLGAPYEGCVILNAQCDGVNPHTKDWLKPAEAPTRFRARF